VPAGRNDCLAEVRDVGNGPDFRRSWTFAPEVYTFSYGSLCRIGLNEFEKALLAYDDPVS